MNVDIDLSIEGQGQIALGGQGLGTIMMLGPGLNVTLSGLNSLRGQASNGGAIVDFSSADLAIQDSEFSGNSSVANNRASGEGGGVSVVGGSLTMRANLLAGDSAAVDQELTGSFTSQGHNPVQIRGTSTGYLAKDLANDTAPQIGLLQPDGGLTFSMMPLSGSPLIDAVSPTNCALVPMDQRGYLRPGTGCGIGSIEGEHGRPPRRYFLTTLSRASDMPS